MSQSPWTHALCDACWDTLNPERIPYQIKPEYAITELCCRCQTPTRSGIFLQGDPTEYQCGDIHELPAGTP